MQCRIWKLFRKFESVAPNLVLTCRWKKCMGQLDGNENRPGQLGDTGQIVLNRCDSGNCDCIKIEEEVSAG